jgi:hypothetical protein
MAKVTVSALAESEISALRRAIGTDPATRAAARLGVDRHTLLRAVAGYTVRTGTACQIRLALALAAKQEPTP